MTARTVLAQFRHFTLNTMVQFQKGEVLAPKPPLFAPLAQNGLASCSLPSPGLAGLLSYFHQGIYILSNRFRVQIYQLI